VFTIDSFGLFPLMTPMIRRLISFTSVDQVRYMYYQIGTLGERVGNYKLILYKPVLGVHVLSIIQDIPRLVTRQWTHTHTDTHIHRDAYEHRCSEMWCNNEKLICKCFCFNIFFYVRVTIKKMLNITL
jgi:hypothetical protein